MALPPSNNDKKTAKIIPDESYDFGKVEVVFIPDDDELFAETDEVEIEVFTHYN